MDTAERDAVARAQRRLTRQLLVGLGIGLLGLVAVALAQRSGILGAAEARTAYGAVVLAAALLPAMLFPL